jgi:hypothetical protein
MILMVLYVVFKLVGFHVNICGFYVASLMLSDKPHQAKRTFP